MLGVLPKTCSVLRRELDLAPRFSIWMSFGQQKVLFDSDLVFDYVKLQPLSVHLKSSGLLAPNLYRTVQKRLVGLGKGRSI